MCLCGVGGKPSSFAFADEPKSHKKGTSCVCAAVSCLSLWVALTKTDFPLKSDKWSVVKLAIWFSQEEKKPLCDG